MHYALIHAAGQLTFLPLYLQVSILASAIARSAAANFAHAAAIAAACLASILS